MSADFKPVMHPAGFDEALARILGEVRTGHYFSMAELLAAPGQDLITMYPMNHYARVSGTSFSAPLVAGGAALLVDLNKKTDQDKATVALSHAQPLAPGLELGAGELDLYQACTNLPKK